MRFEPSWLKELEATVRGLPSVHLSRMSRPGGLTVDKFLHLAGTVQDHQLDHYEQITGPPEKDVRTDMTKALNAVKSGEVAFVVLVSPRSLDRLPKLGASLLSVKLLQAPPLDHDGEPSKIQTWFMVPPQMFKAVEAHLLEQTPIPECTVFEQFESLALDPLNNVATKEGNPIFCDTGSGDLGFALEESGVFADNPNVKYLFVVECENVLATFDVTLLNEHIESRADLTCELVRQTKNSTRNVLVDYEDHPCLVGCDMVQQEFFEEALFVDTGTMIINVDALKQVTDLRWHKTRVYDSNKVVSKFERRLSDITDVLYANYVVVDRAERLFNVSENSLEAADDLLMWRL